MTDIELSISLPLDSEGFLRRECPNCERELKWRAAGDREHATPPAPCGYFCPYCAAQAAPGAWWTKAQLEAAKAHAYREVLQPEIDKLADAARGASGGLVGFGVEVTDPDAPPPLTEGDDMRRVDFACHPDEPVKVPDEWHGPVHCPLCGTSTNPPTA